MNINLSDNLYKRNLFNINWSAITAGSVMAFGLTLLFNLLFIASGILMINEATDETKILVGFIFYLACGFILLYFSGIITGKLAHPKAKMMLADSLPIAKTNGAAKKKSNLFCSGCIHGFLAWVLYLMINFIFMSVVAQSTPIESPFIYASEKGDTIIEGVIEDVENSKNNDIGQQPKKTTAPSNEIGNIKNNLQDNAQIIFIILITGALGFTLGSAYGIKKINKRPEYQLH